MTQENIMPKKTIKFCYALALLLALAFLIPASGAWAAKAAAPTPQTIIALPPVNKSTKAGAENFFKKAINEPVLYIGYQALPQEMTSQFLLKNGIVNVATLDDLSMKKFKTLLGADAAMFTTITDWTPVPDDKNKLNLMVTYVLRDSDTGKTLWTFSDEVNIDLEDRFYAGKLGILTQTLLAGANSMTMSLFNKPLQDYTVTLDDIPTGPYNPTITQP